MYSSLVPKTVEKNSMRPSNTKVNFNIYCAVVIIQSVWQLVLQTKSNHNIMVEIYMCLFKTLNQRNTNICNRLNCFVIQVNQQGMMCVHSFLSEDIKQDYETTASNSKLLIDLLKQRFFCIFKYDFEKCRFLLRTINMCERIILTANFGSLL